MNDLAAPDVRPELAPAAQEPRQRRASVGNAGDLQSRARQPWGRYDAIEMLAHLEIEGNRCMLHRLNEILDTVRLTPEQAREVSLEIEARQGLLQKAFLRRDSAHVMRCLAKKRVGVIKFEAQ